MNPFIQILGFRFPTYGLFSGCGILVAAFYLYITNHKNKSCRLPIEDLLHIGVLSMLGAFVGAKLLYLVANLPLIWQQRNLLLQHPSLLLGLLSNGLVFYGGLFGGLAAAWWYCRKYDVLFQNATALLIPAIPLFHMFGRLGCFFAGCCWGIPVAWGIRFNASLGAPNGIRLLPVQLIEAGGNLFLFLLLHWISQNKKNRSKALPLYLLMYGFFRFGLEFFRGDLIRGHFWLFSTSQWIALLVLVATAFWLFRARMSGKSPT